MYLLGCEKPPLLFSFVSFCFVSSRGSMQIHCLLFHRFRIQRTPRYTPLLTQTTLLGCKYTMPFYGTNKTRRNFNLAHRSLLQYLQRNACNIKQLPGSYSKATIIQNNYANIDFTGIDNEECGARRESANFQPISSIHRFSSSRHQLTHLIRSQFPPITNTHTHIEKHTTNTSICRHVSIVSDINAVSYLL